MNPLRWFLAWIVADYTPTADRAELAKAIHGDTHSRRVVKPDAAYSHMVESWVTAEMDTRRINAEIRARLLFERGLVSAAADALIASQMSDGQPHVVEVGS